MFVKRRKTNNKTNGKYQRKQKKDSGLISSLQSPNARVATISSSKMMTNRRPLADVAPRLLLPAALPLAEGKPKRFSCWVPAVPNARKHTR